VWAFCLYLPAKKFSEYYKTDEQTLNTVLVLEMGNKTLDEYWKKIVTSYENKRYDYLLEFVILKVLRQIAASIQEVHDRGKLHLKIREKAGP
jgi:serine/threonine protein kinase